MSEPWALVSLDFNLNKGYISQVDHSALLKAVTKLMLKVEPNSGVERINVKLTVANAWQFDGLHQFFPEMKFIFNARHPK